VIDARPRRQGSAEQQHEAFGGPELGSVGMARQDGVRATVEPTHDTAAAEWNVNRCTREVEGDPRHVTAVSPLVCEHAFGRVEGAPAAAMQGRVRAPEREQVAVQPQQGAAIGALRGDIGSRRLLPFRMRACIR
jgi:hypothetical protein